MISSKSGYPQMPPQSPGGRMRFYLSLFIYVSLETGLGELAMLPSIKQQYSRARKSRNLHGFKTLIRRSRHAPKRSESDF